jgi:putative ABC transport system permease protein
MRMHFWAVRAAWLQLVGRRTQSFLTSLGVIIGIIAVTVMSAAIRSIDAIFDRTMDMLGSDVLYVEQSPWDATDDFWQYKNRPDIRPSTADTLNRLITGSRHSLLQLAVAAPGISQTIAYGNRVVSDINLIGTTDAYAVVLPTNCQAGRFLDADESRTGRNVCVIGADVAQSLFDTQNPVGQLVRIGQQQYRIIGVFQKQGSFLGLLSFDSDVVIPLVVYEKYFQTGADNASILVKAKDPKRLDQAREELRGALRRIRAVSPGNDDNFTINQEDAFRSTLSPIKAGLEAIGLFITSLSLFVGGIGITNMTLVGVKDRTQEIGTRMALGASRRTILLQFLIEPLSICVLAGGIGLVVSILVCGVASVVYPALPISFPPETALVALGISVMCGVVSGLAPAWRASRLSPVDALRYE